MPETHQRYVALQEANRVRMARAKLHREIHALSWVEGRGMLGDILTAPPDFMLTAKVADVLGWPTGMGPSRTQRMMRATMIGDRTIGQTTPRQRLNLARCLRGLEDLVESEEHRMISMAGEERAA